MYYIIFDQLTKHPSVLEGDLGFLQDFVTYEAAVMEAEKWMEDEDCKSYMIVGECTDERNHII
jgi:hypothetical protein